MLVIPVMHSQESKKALSEEEGAQVHVHLTVENLAGCLFNFGFVEAGIFLFTTKNEMK